MLGEYDEDEGVTESEALEETEEDDDDSLPPMEEEEEKELLFMIEFLVDTLRTRRHALDSKGLDPCTLRGQNCIVLTFLHFPPMRICEMDLDAEKNVGGEETVFNSGKSLVFALTESQFEEPPPVFLEVSAFKEMPHGFQFPSTEIGRTKIDLSELFHMVFDKYDERPDELPVAKSIKDNYLLSSNGAVAADVDIYIRLTCLGQNIVTEFQKSDGVCDPFLFKNLESEKVYECRQAMQKGEVVPVPEPSGRQCNVPVRTKPDPEDENYEQIFAEINGSALIVTMEKSRRRDKAKLYKLDDFCDCEVPLPPELVEGLSELSVTPVSTGQQEIPEGTVGKCRNNLIFPVPPSDKLAQPDGFNAVSYKVNTCNQGEAHGHKGKESYRIVTNDDVTRPSLPNDPEKDVFVLRIIKRGRSNKGKGALELEFKIPKEKIVPPPKPPYMLSVAVGPDKQKDKRTNKK